MANVPRLVIVANWKEYCRIVDERCSNQDGLLFRGHADLSWRLASVWERFLLRQKRVGDTTGTRLIRDRKLEAFKELCREGGYSLPSTDIECWAIGRHLGLVTPLLDWTINPYVAAFFAWLTRYEIDNPDLGFWGAVPQNWGKNPVVVWELRDGHRLVKEGEFELLTVVSAYADRQRAQDGVFTFLDHAEYADVETYLTARGLADHLTKYVLAGRAFKDAFVDLSRRDINYSTLFPDMLGAAKQANIDAVTKLFTEIHACLSNADHQRKEEA